MKNKKEKQKKAFFLILNLILSIVAFGFLVGMQVESASGQKTEFVPSTKYSGLYEAQGTDGYTYYIDDKGNYYKGDKGNFQSVTADKVSGAGIAVSAAGGAQSTGYFFNPNFGGGILEGVTGKAIFSALTHAVLVFGLVYMISSIAGKQQKESLAYATAAAAAIFTGEMVWKTFFIKGTAGGESLFWTGKEGAVWNPLTPGGLMSIGVALIVSAIVLHLMYKKEGKKVVTYEGKPWEAPSGGKDCEKCNHPLYPCSEYRCKSLGQACQLLNPGTGNEKCAWVNPRDVNSPIIQTWNDALTKEHKYVPNNAIRPPDRGVKIAYNKASDGCVKAFTPLSFGVVTNEPAQCKIDENRTIKYDEMQYYFGGSSMYEYNHTQTLSLPGPEHINAEAPELKVDGAYNLYVRCKDANGNANDDLFVFSFCVEKGPDVTPPQVIATSIGNEMPVQYGLNKTELIVYVNEPSECRWSKLDLGYDNMETEMSCAKNVYEMNNIMTYPCTTTLTGLKDREENVFYFKCKDQPLLGDSSDRNTMQESYKYILKGTQPLNIIDIKPNGTIQGATSPAEVWLEVITDYGYNSGDSWCSYSDTGNKKDYVVMYETGTNIHKQRLDLGADKYAYYVSCVDLGGNSVNASTSFNIEIDVNPPKVARVYKEGEKLKIITDEKSSCSYSNNDEKKCNFAIDDGTNMPVTNSTEHYGEWVNKNYYIRCADANNEQPNPTECSIIVKARS